MWFSIPLGPGKMTNKRTKRFTPSLYYLKNPAPKNWNLKNCTPKTQILVKQDVQDVFQVWEVGLCLLPSIWLTQSNGVLSFFHDLNVYVPWYLETHIVSIQVSPIHKQRRAGDLMVNSLDASKCHFPHPLMFLQQLMVRTRGVGLMVSPFTFLPPILASLQFRMPSLDPPPDWLSTPAGLQPWMG